MKEKIELLYRTLFIIICGLGVGMHFDLWDGDYNIHVFSFFTVQSNIFCLVLMCVLLINRIMGKNPDSGRLVYFKGMALSAIICTFFVYHFAEGRIKYPLLNTGIFGLPAKTLLSHYIIPFMFVADWLVFQRKGNFKWWHAAGWLFFPLLYFFSFITRCCCTFSSNLDSGEKFPYYFMDYETLGIPRFCYYILALLIIMVIENILIILLDKLFNKYQKNQTGRKGDSHGEQKYTN